MRWFKHFTDNHRGRTVQFLLDEMGPVGPFIYYVVVELCAEKLQKAGQKKVEEIDCEFVFNVSVIESVTRTKASTIHRCLSLATSAGVLSWTSDGRELHIKMPILLDLLDRDLKGSRGRRAQDAKKPRLELDKELELESEYIIAKPIVRFNFSEVYNKYPINIKGSDAEKRFNEQIKSPQDFENLKVALDNYLSFLSQPENTWRKPKQSFAAFLGTKSSGLFWTDFIHSVPLSIKPKSNLDKWLDEKPEEQSA